jgi:hypothetical protein
MFGEFVVNNREGLLILQHSGASDFILMWASIVILCSMLDVPWSFYLAVYIIPTEFCEQMMQAR